MFYDLIIDVLLIRFAQRLDPSLQINEKVLRILKGYDMVAFDGDAIHTQSFTKFLVHLLASCGDDLEDAPVLLAYRLNYSHSDDEKQWKGAIADVSYDYVVSNWHEKITTLFQDGHIEVINDNEYDLTAAVPLNNVTLFVKNLKALAHPNERDPYSELGLQALLNSKSTVILAVGGGSAVKEEYDQYVNEIPEIQWYAWLVDRVAICVQPELINCHSIREKCFFENAMDESGSLDNVQYIFPG